MKTFLTSSKFSPALSSLKVASIICMLIPSAMAGITGDWEHKVQGRGRTDLAQVKFYVERFAYSKGGLLVDFPSKYFTKVPFIYVTIECLKHAYDVTSSTNVTIEKCSNTNAVVHINKVTQGFIFNDVIEAEDGEFLINVLAIGD